MAAAVAQANIRHLLLIENNLKSEEGATKHNRTTHVYLPFPPHSWGRFPSCPLLPLPLAQKQSWNSRVWRFRLFFRILLQSKVCSRCICFARWEHTSRCLSYNCLSLCSSGRQITAFRPKMCDCCFIIRIASLVFVSLLFVAWFLHACCRSRLVSSVAMAALLDAVLPGLLSHDLYAECMQRYMQRCH